MSVLIFLCQINILSCVLFNIRLCIPVGLLSSGTVLHIYQPFTFYQQNVSSSNDLFSPMFMSISSQSEHEKRYIFSLSSGRSIALVNLIFYFEARIVIVIPILVCSSYILSNKLFCEQKSFSSSLVYKPPNIILRSWS